MKTDLDNLNYEFAALVKEFNSLPSLVALNGFRPVFGFTRYFSAPFARSKTAHRVHFILFPRVPVRVPEFRYAILVCALAERIHGTTVSVRRCALDMLTRMPDENTREVLLPLVLVRDPCKLIRDVVNQLSFKSPKKTTKHKAASNLVDLFKAKPKTETKRYGNQRY